MRVRICLLAFLLFFATNPECWPAQASPDVLALQKLSFVYGREYFVLRSGRAKIIWQADGVDLGPAFTFILVDATNPSQTHRKEMAFNFAPPGGFASSALQVVLGGYPFTALGNRTVTRWVDLDGSPAVGAVWWAGGGPSHRAYQGAGGQGHLSKVRPARRCGPRRRSKCGTPVVGSGGNTTRRRFDLASEWRRIPMLLGCGWEGTGEG